MLVLSRKLDESIIIDGHIEVTVLSVQGRRVKLGIRAPGDVAIRRQEIELDTPAPAGRQRQLVAVSG